MSHSDTILRIALIALLLSAEGHAASKCEKLFRPSITASLQNRLVSLNPLQLLSRKKNQFLTPEQVQELRAFLNSDLNVKPYGMGHGISEPLFMYIWSLLPEPRKAAIVSLFESAPVKLKKYRAHITENLSRHQLEAGSSNTYLEILFSNWGDYLNQTSAPIAFGEWIKKLQHKQSLDLNAGIIKIQELKYRFNQGVQYQEATAYWKRTGVIELPTRTENGLFYTNVNGRWLRSEVNVKNQSIRLLVPREIIGRAAWNPLYTNVLVAKMSSGQTSMKHYPAFLATNGIFYLTDGNHRFSLDSRPEVWVEMSFPVMTSSMSISFDAMGIPQPPVEKLVKLQMGEITLEDIIGKALADKIIYP